MTKTRLFAVVAIIACVIAILVIIDKTCIVSPQAQPQAIAANIRPVMITVNTTPITTTSNFIDGYDWASAGYSMADVYYSIDQTVGNYITLTLQVSPDSVTWMSHTVTDTIVADNQTDAYGCLCGVAVQLPYFRVTATMTGTDFVTPTVKVYLR